MRKTLLLLLLGSAFQLHAQNNTVSGGGVANGTAGSVSYTIGQIAYASLSGTNGSIIQGMQQPLEISIVTNITEIVIDLKAQVYPNPTTEQLILSIGNQDLKHLQYVLVDIQGKRLKSDRINNMTTDINVSKLSNGTYFLRVLSNNKQIKTFQIVKNK